MLTEKSFDTGESSLTLLRATPWLHHWSCYMGQASAGKHLVSFFQRSNRIGISTPVICMGMACRAGPAQAIGSLISCPTPLLSSSNTSVSQQYYVATQREPW
jgi:hypothetical protein